MILKFKKKSRLAFGRFFSIFFVSIPISVESREFAKAGEKKIGKIRNRPSRPHQFGCEPKIHRAVLVSLTLLSFNDE